MNTTKTMLLLAAGGALALAWACGGSTTTNGSNEDGGSSGSSGSASGSSSGAGSSSGTGSSSGAGSSSGTGSSSGAGSSSGSSSSGGVPMPYMCNGQPCTAPNTCCTVTNMNGTSVSCELPSACDGGRSIECTSKANCPSGDYCCGRAGTGGGGSTTCEATCPMGSAALCDPANGNADCPMGDQCRTAGGGMTGICLPMRDGGFPPPMDAGGGGG